MPEEARRRCWILWNGSYRGLGAQCGCWDSNLGPLEEPLVLLITEPSPQFLTQIFFKSDYLQTPKKNQKQAAADVSFARTEFVSGIRRLLV